MPKPTTSHQPPVVTTQYGPVQGVSRDGLEIFRAIPYAAPPVGELRFRPPVEPEPWVDPLDASRFGPAAPQQYDELELPVGSPMSEDCLTVNVWTRGVGNSDPVVVFIHGGGFVSGTASNPWYDGAKLAARGVTVVTIQYRIGPFGWLNVSSLGADYARSMNNGLLDQMAALRWVRANIAAFGGDPSNVTVAGESAGAMSISALLGIPEADGLYDRVILQSGTAGSVATRAWSESVTEEFVKSAGLQSPEQLLALSTEELLHAAQVLYASQFSDTAFHPVVDGALLPNLPATRIASTEGPSVPVIIGTTLDEARYWLYFMPELARVPLAYSKPWLTSLVGDRRDEVIAAYRTERPDLDGTQTQLALVGDVSFRMPSIRMAESLAERGVDVRMYLATVPGTGLNGTVGSPHGVELPFVFGTTTAANTFVADDARSRALADRTQELWVSFAKGEPPRSGELAWPTYDTTTRSTLILDHDLRIDDDPYPRSRTAWDGLAFDGSDPALDRSTPLSFTGTNPYHPMVIAGYLGWKPITAGLAAILTGVGLVVTIARLLGRKNNKS